MTNIDGKMDEWLLNDHEEVTKGMKILFKLQARSGGKVYLVAMNGDKIYLLDNGYYTSSYIKGEGSHYPNIFCRTQTTNGEIH